MKLRITLFATLLVLLSACFTGCKKELKDFSFSYSMESVDNYKLMVLFDSDKTFRIEEYNYYMDIMYQVSFTTEGKEKFISIRNSDTGQFSASFVKLIGFINTFLNNHKND